MPRHDETNERTLVTDVRTMYLNVVKAITDNIAVSFVFSPKTKWYGYADHVGSIGVKFAPCTG